MNIRLLTISELQKALNIYKQVTEKMLSHNVTQWDATYPNKDIVAQDIYAGNLYGLYNSNNLCAVTCLNNHFDQAYSTVYWTLDLTAYMAVHRLATHPDFQGKGMAKTLMFFAEEIAIKLGFRGIALDTMTTNKLNMDFYHNLNYKPIGTVNFDRISTPFMCFEKLL